jgi:hypothetical protein
MIPIRVRLVIDHYEVDNDRDDDWKKKKQKINRSLDTYFPPLLHTTTTSNGSDGTNVSNASLTAVLPITDSSSMTVSDFTQYIVEEIYINNGEGHFIESNQRQRRRCKDQELELKFVNMLLQRLKCNGTSNTLIPVITTFRYGGRDTRKIILDKDSHDDHNGTSHVLTKEDEGDTTANCLIDFSLIEEQTEGYAMTISPTVNADKMFRTLLCCSSHHQSHKPSSSNDNVKRLELILNAKVMIYRPLQSESESAAIKTTTAASSSSEQQLLIESTRKSKCLSSQGIIPKSIQKDCNLVGKNETVRNEMNDDDEQLIYQGTTPLCGIRGSTMAKTTKRKIANEVYDDEDDKVYNNCEDNIAIQTAVQLIDGVPPILDQAWKDQFVNWKGLLEPGHEQSIDSRNDSRSAKSCIANDDLEGSHSLNKSASSSHSSIILLTQENEKLDGKCPIYDDDNSASGSTNNNGSDSSSSSSGGDYDDEDEHIVAPKNDVDDGVINVERNVKETNRASEMSQFNPAVDEHCTKDTNTSETADSSSSSSSSSDSSSDNEEPNISDKEPDDEDDNRDDVSDKNILHMEDVNDSVIPFKAAHVNNSDSLVKADELANQDELKNRETSLVLNKSPSSESRSDDDSSDSDSSSSSSSSSDDSDDEGSIVEGTQILAEEAAKSNIKTQQASQNNMTNNAPTSRMIGRATPYHTSIDVNEQVFTQESEIVPTNLFGNRFGNNQLQMRGGDESSTPPNDSAKINGEDDKDESSSSTSDTSSSSDSSSDSDSESSNSSRKRKEGKGEAEEVVKPASIAPVPSSILPVVRTSRGRRRTPLVSMSRRIIINTTTGVPKTESFAR